MSGVTLAPRHYEALLGAIAAAYELQDLQTFPEHAMQAVRKVVEADLLSYTELNPRRRRVISLLDCPDANDQHDGCKDRFERHMAEHPLIRHFEQNPMSPPAKISDFLSFGQWHDLPLYQEFYRLFETERQMVVPLPSESPMLLGIAVNRSGRDFTERDRTLLDHLRRHLVLAYRHAELVTELKKDAARSERLLQALSRVCLLLRADGHVLRTSDVAASLLRLYCPHERHSSSSLPATIWAWTRKQMTVLDQTDAPLVRAEPMVLSRPGGQLVVRLIPDVEPETFMLVLEEKTVGRALAALRGLGLTTREAEVLYCVTQGQTNDAVGRYLHISPRTVQKHLERIFAKLGVTTRTAAVVRALQCLGGEAD